MGVSTIQLWIPDLYKNNCTIDNNNHFVATVQHCDGTVLQWSGGRYQTKDGTWHPIKGDPSGLSPGTPGFYDGVPGTGDPGHVIFDLPPGCYVISASTHVWTQPGAGPGKKLLVGNLSTHKAVVCACCDEHHCVTLFQPTGFHCGIIQVVETLFPVLVGHNVITREELANAQKALQPILDKLEPSGFDQADLGIAHTVAKRLNARS